jgi:hypothetical protein
VRTNNSNITSLGGRISFLVKSAHHETECACHREAGRTRDVYKLIDY